MSGRPRFHRLRVAGVERLCSDAVAVTFEVPEELAAEYAFWPGQSLTLRRMVEGREERRNYSICASAGCPPRIGVREVPGGLLSSWLVHQVRVGHEIDVLPPSGNFTPDTLDTPASARHVLIAAGSGITPVLSIAASLLAEGNSQVTLFYGNRRSATVMFADELADLKDAYPQRFELVHLLSREPRESELLSGRLDERKLRVLFAALVDIDAVDHWWLCGPYGVITDARKVLSCAGVPPDKVHSELFFVDVPPEPIQRAESAVDGPSSSVTIKLDGRSTTLALPRDTPVLDAAWRVRPDLPFACKSGVCGTCRAKVTTGEVRMRRNFALERSELDAGFVLTCQAIPVSDVVDIDYDA